MWVPEARPVAAAARDRGFYVNAEVARQNVIGGSLVGGVDTLAQETRNVTGLSVGARNEVRGWTFGGELGIGRLDGDLVLLDPARALRIDYRSDSQWHWGLSVGHTIPLRRDHHLFAYLREVTREFDVTIRFGDQTFEQGDEQGLLRYGLGWEAPLIRGALVRLTAGSSRADFGDRPTNLELDRPLEVGLGLTWQF